MLWETLLATATGCLANCIDYRAKKKGDFGARKWLDDRAVKKAFVAAISNAAQRFDKAYHDHAESFFDEEFLTRAAIPELHKLFLPYDAPNPKALAELHAEQFVGTASDATKPATAFLEILLDAMRADPALRDIVTTRESKV